MSSHVRATFVTVLFFHGLHVSFATASSQSQSCVQDDTMALLQLPKSLLLDKRATLGDASHGNKELARRRRSKDRNSLIMKLAEVKAAVTPWSKARTQYSFKNRICTGSGVTFEKCTAAKTSTSKPAGCVSECRIFQSDCSGLVRWLVKTGLGDKGGVVEAKMSEIVKSRRNKGQLRRRESRNGNYPLSCDFYDFFTEEQTPGVTNSRYDGKYPWHSIEKVKDLRAGDIIVWRYKDETGSTTGHVTMVFSEPILVQGTTPPQYKIQIADSAKSGHSPEDDSRKVRCPEGEKCGGVGIGTMLFETENDKITGYQWSADTTKSIDRKSTFAMGRISAEDYN